MDGVQKYTCVCKYGYTGKNCESEVDPCAPNPCQNNGFCCRHGKTWCAHNNVALGKFQCYCASGYTGRTFVNIVYISRK